MTGVVSSANSLVGTSAYDSIGGTGGSSYFCGVVPLSNGNYVVVSPGWNNGSSVVAGAVTWVDGNVGRTGPVSVDNSLVGTTTNDRVGTSGVIALTNGNYVVASSYWHNTGPGGDGAVTWGSGQDGLTGPVSIGNSLVGSSTNCCDQVTALTNGNYVVTSPDWSGIVELGGAVTWADGDMGLVGAVSAENSLVGSAARDSVGSGGIAALTNGNYVVASHFWQGESEDVGGAATWANGEEGLTGIVSSANSLVGTGVSDVIVTALTNGNYVVAMPDWNWKDASESGLLGAVSWADGTTGLSGPVSVENSLVNTRGIYGGQGTAGVTALSDGNYVVASPRWSPVGAEPPARNLGAVTWGNGTTGVVGEVSANNSMIGTFEDGRVGDGGVIALDNGDYVISSPQWPGVLGVGGAVTWANAYQSIGEIGPDNSLVDLYPGNYPIISGVVPLEDGNYSITGASWGEGRGAVVLENGAFRQTGTIQEFNSVTGTTIGGGGDITQDYDAAHKTLIVGRPADNIVTILTLEQIFASSFE
jgi:predicted RNase H-like HicB family nuclease